ncbi:hypothetical protein ABGB14_13310 [Nonomuraea sp. B10E15]|uniref:hypothetical protein n=1 Tax=Nonomuraea sp. B10E15 TaxID=3153560 RepID=UPI00325E88F9
MRGAAVRAFGAASLAHGIITGVITGVITGAVLTLGAAAATPDGTAVTDEAVVTPEVESKDVERQGDVPEEALIRPRTN